MDRSTSPEFKEEAKPVMPLLPFRPGTVRDEEFNFPDGNVFLTVENVTFVVHKSKLSEFRKLKPMLLSHTEIVLEGRAVDFRNTFKVLWPKFYFSSSEFDVAVWMSAILVANKYDHPALRTFAISNLEREEFPIMDYLQLAHVLDIPHWETRTIDYLVSRDEPITIAEAGLLGMERFVEAVVCREQRLTAQRSDLVPTGPANELRGFHSGSIPRASVLATSSALETNDPPRGLLSFPRVTPKNPRRSTRSRKGSTVPLSFRMASPK